MKNSTRSRIVMLHVTMTMGGGVGSVIETLIAEQLERGYGVALLCGKEIAAPDFAEKYAGKIEILPIDRAKGILGKRALFGMHIRSAYRLLQEKYPDREIVVHLHNLYTVGLLGKVKGLPIVCTLHGLYEGMDTLGGRVVIRSILAKIRRECGVIVGVGTQTAAAFGKYGAKEIEVIFNGVRRFRRHVRQEGVFRVAQIGFVNRYKGADIFMQAAKLLNERGLPIVMELVGTADWDETLGREIEAETAREGTCLKLIGQIPHAAQNYVPQIDVAVLMSRNEGLGLALVEAMASGIPCIGSKVAGITDVIDNGTNGYLIGRNADELVDRILELYYNTNDYERMSDEAEKKYHNAFSVEVMAEKYERLYEKVLNDKIVSKG